MINKLQTEFRNWKIGWVEKHYSSGDEFDEESYIEKHHEYFFVDLKTIYKTNFVILDHSSSTLRMEQEHKRTITPCKALDYLGVKLSVFTFNTQKNKVKRWIVKSPEAR